MSAVTPCTVQRGCYTTLKSKNVIIKMFFLKLSNHIKNNPLGIVFYMNSILFFKMFKAAFSFTVDITPIAAKI